ncbi:hypothetical protein AB5J55_12190 [Streptomyces sp. R11]|uniref:Nephrocystin 3-like N-terminal domain-containing protein n=1 Tax=Streptomyces sp. R11 TaxID=3238625 RepID=A0AB39MZ96_9ACTN
MAGQGEAQTSAVSGAFRVPVLSTDELVERRGMLEEVDAWLTETASDVCLVTGPPGTGKTVFAKQLAERLAMLADVDGGTAAPRLCLAHYCDANDEQTLDPLEFVKALSQALTDILPDFATAVDASIADIGVSIRNETSFQIDQMQPGAQAVGLRIDNLSALGTRRALNRLVLFPLVKIAADPAAMPAAPPLVVIVDDLSAAFAYHDEDNISAVLQRLTRRTNLRFVVTSRADPWATRGLPQPRISLARNDENTAADLTRYVDLRLSDAEVPRRQAWIERVVEVSAGNFLVAKHVLDDRLHEPGGLDEDPTAARFPSSLDALYEEWVSRHLQADRTRWRRCYVPVLGTIAIAQGAGFDSDQIAAVTALPSTMIQEVLEDCAQYLYIRESGEVRYYHDSFREFLTRRKVISSDWHRSVAQYLAETGARNWNEADDYTREFLPYHASQANLLDDLVTDPDFLINVDPRAIERAVLQTYGWTELSASRYLLLPTYLRNVAPLVGQLPGERAARLELSARSTEDRDVAAAFAAVTVVRPWQPVWAHAIRSYPHQVLGRQPGGVDAMVVLSVDGRRALATGGAAGDLRIWDIELNELLLPDIKIDDFGISSVSACRVGDAWYLVVASPFRGLILHGPGLAERIEFGAYEDTCITKATVCTADDAVVAVVGFSDGSLLIWDIQSGDNARLNQEENVGPILALGSSSGPAAEVISGSAHGRVQTWRIEMPAVNGTTEQPDWAPQHGWVGAADIAHTPDGLVYVVGNASGEICVSLSGDTPGESPLTLHAPANRRCMLKRVNYQGHVSQSIWHGTENHNSYEHLLENQKQQDEQTAEEGADEGEEVEPFHTVQVYGGVNALTLHSPSGTLASGSEAGEVMLTSMNDHHGVVLRPFGEPVGAVLFTDAATGPVLIAADRTRGTIRCWHLDAGGNPAAARIGSLTQITKLLASEDGRHVAAASDTGKIEVFEVASGERIVTFSAPEGNASTCFAFPGTTFVRIINPQDGSSPVVQWADILSDGAYEGPLADVRYVRSAVSLRLADPAVVLLVEMIDGGHAITTLDFRSSQWRQFPVEPLYVADEAAARNVTRWPPDPEERDAEAPLSLYYPELHATWDEQGAYVVVVANSFGHYVDTSGGLYGFSVLHSEGGDDDSIAPTFAGCCHRGKPAFVIPDFDASESGTLLQIHELDSNPVQVNASFNTISRSLGSSTVADIPFLMRAGISATAASDDGTLIVSGGSDGVLRWWREDDEQAGQVDVHSVIRSLAIARGGVVIVATDDHLLAVRI